MAGRQRTQSLRTSEWPESSSAEDRVAVLEREAEALRVDCDRQKKRIAELEELVKQREQAVPAIGTVVRTAMSLFEAKEAALKRMIVQLDHDYNAAVQEKDASLRALQEARAAAAQAQRNAEYLYMQQHQQYSAGATIPGREPPAVGRARCTAATRRIVVQASQLSGGLKVWM